MGSPFSFGRIWHIQVLSTLVLAPETTFLVIPAAYFSVAPNPKIFGRW